MENIKENKKSEMREYILASGSPRRIEIMKAHGIDPVVMPASVDESLPLHHSMTETVTFLAFKKAKYVEEMYLSSGAPQQGDAPIIIAADTIVFKDEIMGKPKDKADGFRMLSALRGDMHYVATGVALIEAGMQHSSVFYEVTKVFFKDYSDEELLAYLDTDEAYDKAGGYAIQGAFAKYTDHIEGDYDNVVGFPWSRISNELTRFNSDQAS